jgi:glucokinase
MMLAGDVGGTKTNLGLFAEGASGLRLEASATFASAEFSGLTPVVRAFLRQVAAGPGGAPEIAAACFGVAGPVDGNRSSTPNLAWEIDGAALAAELGLPAVLLVNDLVATAQGIPLLRDDETVALQPAEAVGAGGSAAPALPPAGNQVLIAAGTGLGMALLPMVEGRRVTVPSEGGHADFSPRDEDEASLLLYLRRRFGEHVSVERVVSGPGLHNVYEYLRDAGYAAESPAVAAALAAGTAAAPGGAGDPARVIAEAGLAGSDALCSRALDLFVAAYGAAAGNLALICTATGGVYIGGGIAPKILPRLQGGLFLRSFLDKGRLADFLGRIPVRVILNQRTAMLGAARCAADLAAHGSGAREPVGAAAESRAASGYT